MQKNTKAPDKTTGNVSYSARNGRRVGWFMRFPLNIWPDNVRKQTPDQTH